MNPVLLNLILVFLELKKKLSQWQIRGKLIKYIPGNGLILTVSKDINKKMDKRYTKDIPKGR